MRGEGRKRGGVDGIKQMQWFEVRKQKKKEREEKKRFGVGLLAVVNPINKEYFDHVGELF